MALKAYTGGLPESAISLIEEGLAPLYAGVEVSRLSSTNGKLSVRKAIEDKSVVFICLDSSFEKRFKSVSGNLFEEDRYHRYTDDPDLAQYLNSTLGASVSSVPDETELSYSNDADSDEFVVDEQPLSVAETPKRGGMDLSAALALIENLQDQVAELSANQISVVTTSDTGISSSEHEHVKQELESTRRSLEGERRQITYLEEQIRNLEHLLKLAKTVETDLTNRTEAQRREIEELSRTVSRLRESDRNISNSELQADLSKANGRIEDLEDALQDKQDELDEVTSRLLDLTERRSHESARILELQAELEAAGSSEDAELAKELENSIYGELISRTGWSSVPPKMPGTWAPKMFRNIMFVFSGSKESNVDTYRRIRDLAGELVTAKDKTRKVLVADFGNDSFSSYVFKPGGVKNAQDWLSEGGDITPFTKATEKFGERVRIYSISPNSYLNDFAYFDVDWFARLNDLAKSGYVVIAYMGDLSSLPGRSLYLTLAGTGPVRIYSKGTISGSDSLYRNLSGLANPARPSVYMYDVMENLSYVKSFQDWLIKNKYKYHVKSVQRGR